ncbi:MAG: TIR domain-containing protein [Pseudomonadota bacterium]
MTDVFISYKREDREKARCLAQAIQSHGHQTWWDINLLPGDMFVTEINTIVQNAKVIVVLWSELSVTSPYVLSEVLVGYEKKNLFPIRLDESVLPIPYNAIFTHDLRHWNGSPDAPELNPILEAIDQKLGKPATAKLVSDPAEHTDHTEEVEFWKSITSTGSGHTVADYLNRYGSQGLFAPMALEKAKLSKDKKPHEAKTEQEDKKIAGRALTKEKKSRSEPTTATMIAGGLAVVLAVVLFFIFVGVSGVPTNPVESATNVADDSNTTDQSTPSDATIDYATGPAKPKNTESTNRRAAYWDWSVFVDEEPSSLCWAVSAPKESAAFRNDKTVRVVRGKIQFAVTNFPKSNKKHQISFSGGYEFANASTVRGEIISEREDRSLEFDLFTDGERAWAASDMEDAKIVNAMRTGASLKLKAVSTRGTTTLDTFSLRGFSDALDEVDRRCELLVGR